MLLRACTAHRARIARLQRRRRWRREGKVDERQRSHKRKENRRGTEKSGQSNGSDCNRDERAESICFHEYNLYSGRVELTMDPVRQS